jgi:hypothetical protein
MLKKSSIMRTNFLLKGGIFKVTFGYLSKMGGYTTLMSGSTGVRRNA